MLRRRAALACVLWAAVGCGAPAVGAARPRRRCPSSGDVSIQIEEEAAALDGCTEIPGDLLIGPSFALGGLTGLDRITRIRGRLDVSDNLQLAGLFLPALTEVGGDVVIDHNGQLVTASLHRLERVGGDLLVRDNRELLRLDLGRLGRVAGRVEVSGHPALDTVVLDALSAAASLDLDDNPAWPEEDRRALERRLTTVTGPRP